MLGHRADHSLGFGLALCLGGNLQQAVALLGVGRHGRVGHAIHLLGKDVIHSALADSENADGMRDDLLIGQGTQIRNAIFAEHGHTLIRRPRKHQDDYAPGAEGAARRRPPFVMKNRAAFRQHGLSQIVRRVVRAVMDVIVKAPQFGLILNQAEPESLGQHLFGQVVAGWSEPAGGDQDVGTLPGDPDAGAQALGIVPDDGVVFYVDPNLRKHLREIPGIGVGNMTEKQFCPDRKNLRFQLIHVFPSLISIQAVSYHKSRNESSGTLPSTGRPDDSRALKSPRPR